MNASIQGTLCSLCMQSPHYQQQPSISPNTNEVWKLSSDEFSYLTSSSDIVENTVPSVTTSPDPVAQRQQNLQAQYIPQQSVRPQYNQNQFQQPNPANTTFSYISTYTKVAV